jgi:hypothetical protein
MPIKNTRLGGNCPRIAMLKSSFLGGKKRGEAEKEQG